MKRKSSGHHMHDLQENSSLGEAVSSVEGYKYDPNANFMISNYYIHGPKTDSGMNKECAAFRLQNKWKRVSIPVLKRNS
jgi:hypothetical protein